MVKVGVRAEIVAVVVLMAGDAVSAEGNDDGTGNAGARGNGGSVGDDGGRGFGADYEERVLGDAYQCCCCEAG